MLPEEVLSDLAARTHTAEVGEALRQRILLISYERRPALVVAVSQPRAIPCEIRVARLLLRAMTCFERGQCVN